MVPAGERGHGLVGRALVALLVVAVLLGGVAAWRLDLVGRLGDDDDTSARTPAEPAAVPPPPGLELPALTEPEPVDTPVTPPGRVDPALVQAAVAPYLADPSLGPHVVGVVADLAAGRPVVRFGDGGATIPASVTKLLTTTAALSVLGPETRFTTRVVAGGRKRIVLVGGGDPFLSSKPLPEAYPAARRRADPRRPDRHRAEAAGADLGAARLRRLALLRAVVQPGLAGALPARARRLAGHGALGRRGPARPSAPAGSTTRRSTPRRRSPPRWSPTASPWSAHRPTASRPVVASWRPCSRLRFARSPRGSSR